MSRKAKELPNIMSLSTKAPQSKKDEIAHWKVWRWALKHPNLPWQR